MAESELISSRKSVGKASERSNFAHTCNLLSQYLKEKRSFGDIGLGMPGNLETRGTDSLFCRRWVLFVEIRSICSFGFFVSKSQLEYFFVFVSKLQ